MVTTSPGLRDHYIDSVGTIEEPIVDAIIERVEDMDRLTAKGRFRT